MAQGSRESDEMTMMPVRETEPISLNTAYQVSDFLQRRGSSPSRW